MPDPERVLTGEKTPALSLRQVFFRYEGEEKEALSGVSADFFRGELHVVAGPSGCGKSTLFQVINGVIPHVNEGEFRGTVLYNGKEIQDVPPRTRCREFGLVMQDPDSQFCTFTVEDELAFGLENLGFEADEIRSRIAEILPLVRMEGRERDNLSDLSGGEKQKIAIASSVIMEPEVLLLDEPTANLDPSGRREVLALIADLVRKRGMTVILTEHHLEDIFPQIGRVLLMGENGRILASGTRDEVMRELKGDALSEVRKALPPSLWRTERPSSRWTISERSARGEELLVLRDVHYAYPLRQAGRVSKKGKDLLKGVNLTVRKGDFLVLAGENGAGKSTLMKLIFHVLQKDSGSITLHGKDTSKLGKRRLFRMMGLVFQNPEAQFLTNQVDEELRFSLKKSGLSKEEQEEKIRVMLTRFNLSEDAARSPFALSQGQKRRLSVAVMLLTDQEILFLDEPTYGQDYQNRLELMEGMKVLNEQGVAIVMITHDTELIETYAKRVVLLQDGVIAYDGDPAGFPGVRSDRISAQRQDARTGGEERA